MSAETAPLTTGKAIAEQAQPPAAAFYRANLSLGPSPKLPRHLVMKLTVAHNYLWVDVDSEAHYPLTNAHAPLARCYLSSEGVPALYIGGTCIYLSAAEADQVRATFEPLGLVIRK